MQNASLLLRIRDGSEGKYSLEIHSSDNGVVPFSLSINSATLDARLKTFRDVINHLIRQIGNRVTLEVEEKDTLLQQLSTEGYDAFADWVGTTDEIAFKALTEEIGMLSPGATIQIVTDTFSLPWEVLAVQPNARYLWGLSYTIQRQIAKKPNSYPVQTKRLETSTPLKIGLLTLQDNSLPAIRDQEIPFFCDLHRKNQIVCNMLENLNNDNDFSSEMDKLRKFTNVSRHIYHFACEVLSDPHNPSRDKLVITDWFAVTPDDLRRHSIIFNGKPLIVLNACDTGVGDHPFHTSNLVSNLLNTEIQGVIATESKMPDQFASAFIKKFYEHLLSGCEIGKALYSARQYFLEKHNNPLGLFYSLYQVKPDWRIVSRSLPDKTSEAKNES